MRKSKRYFNVNKLRKDVSILLSVVVIPFMFFFYTFVPEVKVWKTKLFVINAGIFDDVQYLIWFISVKLLTLLLLIIWFVTSTNKWKNVIIIPIFMEFFKLYTIIMSWILDYDYLLNIKEITFLITIFIILIYIQHNYTKTSKTFNKKMNNQINNYLESTTNFDNKHFKSINKEFEKIKKMKSKRNEKEYLIKLIELRDKLII